jgi:copper(I)-binding protein
MRHQLLLLMILPFAFTGCGATPTGGTSAGAIMIEDAWVRPIRVGGTGDAGDQMETTATAMAGMQGMADINPAPGASAAYLTIVNTGAADTLLSAASDVAGAVELHETTMQNNVMRMDQVQRIGVPAHGQVQFKPGGYHMMLIDVKHDLKPGDTVPLTLQFQNAGARRVTAKVRAP